MSVYFFIVGVLLTILEMVVPGFILLPIGVGFIVSGIAGYLIGMPTPYELGLLAVCLAASWIFFSKFVNSKSRTRTPTNFEGLIGKVGVVQEGIRPESSGYVKIFGDSWQATSASPLNSIEVGTQVKIVATVDNKIIVEPV